MQKSVWKILDNDLAALAYLGLLFFRCFFGTCHRVNVVVFLMMASVAKTDVKLSILATEIVVHPVVTAGKSNWGTLAAAWRHGAGPDSIA